MAAGSSTLPSNETVTLKLPSGEEVDAVVPSGMSDDQVHDLMKQKHPEYFPQQVQEEKPSKYQPMVDEARAIFRPENAARAFPLMAGGGIQNVGEELPAVQAAVSGLVGRVRSALGLGTAAKAIPTEPTPTPAQHLENTIASDRARAIQPEFPRLSEGLPEVEEGQPAATELLHKAIQSNHPGPAINTSRSKVGALLEQATGAKPLAPGIPLKNQLDRVTPTESSVVKSHNYNPETRELEITTQSGAKYIHGDVTPEQAQALEDAPSKGKAWNDIRNSSTLVGKVVNGKRVAVQPPKAIRSASPDDLTPLLKESLMQAKAKKPIT